MKIAATEALWDTEQPASFSIFQIGGFTQSDPTPSFSIEIPGLLSYLATGSFHGKVVGLNQNQKQEAAQFGPGNYMPMIELAYWCMRVMAYLGGLMLLLALWGGWLLWRQEARAGEVVPAGRGRRDRAAVPRLLRRLDPDRDGPPAVDRLGSAEDRRRRLADVDDDQGGVQPRRVRRALRRARDRRLLADAPLRAARSARAPTARPKEGRRPRRRRRATDADRPGSGSCARSGRCTS